MKKIFFLMVMFISAVFAQSELRYETVSVIKVFTMPVFPYDTLFTYILQYPKFDESGEKATIAKFLNNTTRKIFTEPGANGKDDYNYLFSSYLDILKTQEEVTPDFQNVPYMCRYYYEKKVKYNSPVSGVGGLTYSGYQYTGGVHGQSWVDYHNYDLLKQKKLKASDVLVKNYHKSLLKIGERIFRKLRGLTSKEKLKDRFWFKNGKFHLNDDYLFRSDGLIFFYNEYEIDCYAGGTTELLIPWKDIKTFVKKDGPLGKYAR